jgi:acetylornithine/succinyldiaminopimelate/putrescine aminotransferase
LKGAVITTPEIAATLTKKVHFNTYGGNPVGKFNFKD